MQGFLTMLRAMGIDPEKLKADAASFFKSVEERFQRGEEHAASLEVRLMECERRLGIAQENEAIEHDASDDAKRVLNG